MQATTDLDVIIVGAGPTGLSLAASLAQRNVRVAVLDKQAAGANSSRAAVVHAHTLEALEEVGVTGAMVRTGVPATRFSIRDRDRVLVNIPFEDLPTRYAYTLMISQAQTESILRERLATLGVDVRWNSAVAQVTQSEESAAVKLADGTTLQARYVVGADGMHSLVRESAGIHFDGARYEESFVLADVRLEGDVPDDEVILYFSPAGMVVVAPLPGGVHRIVATMDTAPEHPGIPDVQALIDARGPQRSRVTVRELVWSSRFRVHHRLAAAYRDRRLLLAGDAAHVHSPAGGQGMNTGILDGLRLAAHLSTALHTGDGTSLAAYEAERRPVADGVISIANRLTRLATVPRLARPLRNLLLRTLGSIPAFRRRLAWRLSGLVNRQREGSDMRAPVAADGVTG